MYVPEVVHATSPSLAFVAPFLSLRLSIAFKKNMIKPRNKQVASLQTQLHLLRRDQESRAIKVRVPRDPPSNMNAGDVWHERRVIVTSLANSEGIADLTAGKMLGALSANSSNLPVRIAKFMVYAICGTAGTYPPTFIQVDFHNEEFMQTLTNSSSIRDSLVDSGGQGAGPPGVGLYIPDSQRLTRSDWSTATGTVLAQANGIPSGTRVAWYITLEFKF